MELVLIHVQQILILIMVYVLIALLTAATAQLQVAQHVLLDMFYTILIVFQIVHYRHF